MLDRALADLSEHDFASFVSNSVSEGRDLEFKRDLPGNSDTDIKEFLADVSSLANAQGGDLIFGIEEKDGVAAKIAGLSPADVDGVLLRLENIVRDGVEPRMVAKIRWVPLADKQGVIVLRIPASLAAPHRVKKNGRFWSRNSRGKYEMDVHELRHAFTESDALPKRLRQFHEEAVAAARGMDMPIMVDTAPTAVLSLMPLGILRERRDVSATRENTLLPVKAQNAKWLPTLEGGLWYTVPDEGDTVRAYALTHRAGRIDCVWTFGGDRELRHHGLTTVVWPSAFEEGVAEMVVHGVGRLQSYGLQSPWVVMVSVLGIKESRMVLSATELSRSAWRSEARFRELILEHPRPGDLLPFYEDLYLLFGTTRRAWTA